MVAAPFDHLPEQRLQVQSLSAKHGHDERDALAEDLERPVCVRARRRRGRARVSPGIGIGIPRVRRARLQERPERRVEPRLPVVGNRVGVPIPVSTRLALGGVAVDGDDRRRHPARPLRGERIGNTRRGLLGGRVVPRHRSTHSCLPRDPQSAVVVKSFEGSLCCVSRRRERAEPLRRCGDASTCGSNGLLIGGNVLLLSTSGFKKTFSGACPTLAVMIAVKYYIDQVNETSMPRHSRERANAVRPFADGHARSARSTGATRSRRRCVRVARLVSSRPMGPIRGCFDSRAFFFLWTCGDSRSGPRTLAHRLPPLEPQASKRHDVPDLRRRATREQRGRPEHPRVEPPGASFAARHVTRARLLEKTRRLLLSFMMTTIPHVSFFFVEKPQRQVAPSPTTDASRPRRPRRPLLTEPRPPRSIA